MKATYKKYILEFKRPSGTSRGIMTHKETFFIILEKDQKFGIGECGILRGLSVDDVPDYEERLKWTCHNIHLGKERLWNALMDYPSIQFGVEQAFLSLNSKDPFLLYPSEFTENNRPIAINGLIWMGDEHFMHQQIQQKLEEGFKCLKLKIGAIDFEKETALLESIRNKYSEKEIELRVDANGAFLASEAMDKLERLSQFDLHSIEQPIKAGKPDEMRKLCSNTPIPIALDEELIGVTHVTEKENLLQTIKPEYIILKPSLIGGFKGSLEWIEIAEERNIKWWVTSALESNIGLNAIAQWTYTLNNNLPQGLGTGGLYNNNFDSPLTVENGTLKYANNKVWETNLIQSIYVY
ncbi:o-succinylbenzoate synthase [Arenibacter sp. BSSL-BM3]|uniref:O-succinylbenzoate synthase n=1 Tax=Arenibacter arenosicollis TaxID=2762274 RepID=A0ABR7QMT5_9FLAO|nr:o-succinylbenzoate synthase [Arenibacter arenosicollis]MBC8768481.1 o-succinylbenzoate synthase [Arenibacter arenosicollis]